MVRTETFQEVGSKVRQAKAEKEEMYRANAGKNVKEQKKDEELYPYRRGKRWDHSLYGAPYSHPKFEPNRFWTIPAKRASQGNVQDMILNSILKVYKKCAISMINLAAGIGSFILMPGMFAAIGIVFLLFAGKYFIEWRNWRWYHRYTMERITVIRPMGNEMYYPRLKYKKGILPFKPV